MAQTEELKTFSHQKPLRDPTLRRNLRTASIVAIALSGGPFGVTWLAASSGGAFLMLMLWRLKQQQIIL
jgi:hypothetical protein